MAAVADDTELGVQTSATSAEDAIKHAMEGDPDLQEIAAKLDSNVIIDPDRELNIDEDSLALDSSPKDSDSASNSSSARDLDNNSIEGSIGDSPKSRKVTKNGEVDADTSRRQSLSSTTSNGSAKVSSKQRKSEDESSSKSKSSTSGASDSSSSKGKSTSESTRKNPLQLLRRLTKFDKTPKKRPDYRSEFAAVVVDRLPQVFVVKYLGHREISGVCGLHHVRKPVDEMVKIVRSSMDENKEVKLPLLYVVVSTKGLDLREHKSNSVKDVAPLGLMPIDYISYGVQDIKYWRVFTCIVVRELSSRSRVATCHAFLCDSSHNGRKMALALGAAFSLYSMQLNKAGKKHNFQVELRPPDELADTFNEEFEA